jgi:hypothetical protein
MSPAELLVAETQLYGNKMSEYMKGMTVTAGTTYEYTVSVGNVFWPMTLSCSFAHESSSPTPVVTATPTPLPGNIRVQYYSYSTNPENDTIYINERIYNDGSKPLSLTELFFDFVSKPRRSCIQFPALRLTLS